MATPRTDTAVPRIEPIPPGVDRPFWSVMIPSYNAGSYLEQALRSALDQDPGPDRMQIAVVDDASPGADRAAAIVDRLAPGRVEFHRAAENLGLSGNWNRCIGLARGRWVHLLHQDDLVLPGFYERLARADAEAPEAGAAFCRHSWIDKHGATLNLSDEEREGAGILEGWLARLAVYQRIQCPAIVVRREVYERLGGFRSDLIYALDWEMWTRIAASFPFWFEPAPLACYREHGANETARLLRTDADLPDLQDAIELIGGFLPPRDRAASRRASHRELAHVLIARSAALLRAGDRRAGMDRLRRAYTFDPSLRFSRTAWAFAKWGAKLWLREQAGRLGRRRGRGPAMEAISHEPASRG